MRLAKNFLSVILLGIFIILALGSDKEESSKSYSKQKSSDNSNAIGSQSLSHKDIALSSINIKDFGWYKGGFGTAMIAILL